MLSAIPISIYNGFPVEEITKNCTVHEARRYLNELIILNEKNKSKLWQVSEMSKEDASAMSKMQLSQVSCSNNSSSQKKSRQAKVSYMSLDKLAQSLNNQNSKDSRRF